MRPKTAFDNLEIGTRFQLVNNITNSTLPTSKILTKDSETTGRYDNKSYIIRPKILVEIIKSQ